MNAKHTPGPWEMTRGYNPTIVADKTTLVTGIHARRDSIGGMQIGEIDANARLIAAAPELLAALEAFLRAPSLGSSRQGSVTLEVQSFNLDAARAAIAKATGK